MKVRLSDIQVGQSCTTSDGIPLTRVNVGNGNLDYYWFLNPQLNHVRPIDPVLAKEMVVFIGDVWEYLEKDELYKYGETSWRLVYHPNLGDWFLFQENKDFSNVNIKQDQVELAKTWAENIISNIMEP